MNKIVIILIVLAVLLTGCEEVYHPELMNVPNLPVIEARITNNPALNYIFVQRTTRFTDPYFAKAIINAKIELLEENGPVYSIKHKLSGLYTFDQALQPGKRYKLRVVIDWETYESDWEKLPPLPRMENFKPETYTQVRYINNTYGIPYKSYVDGFQVFVDIPVIKECKTNLFRWHSYLQFCLGGYVGRDRTFEWISFIQTGSENMVSVGLHSNDSIISRHKLMFNKKDFLAYLDTNTYPSRKSAFELGWIFEIDQYALSEGSYLFFKNVREQLKADGQLLDPINSQIQGNMRCVSNPDKLLLGVFDLCSVTRHQYYVTALERDPIYFHRMDSVYDIPYEGVSPRVPPPFWQRRKVSVN